MEQFRIVSHDYWDIEAKHRYYPCLNFYTKYTAGMIVIFSPFLASEYMVHIYEDMVLNGEQQWLRVFVVNFNKCF